MNSEIINFIRVDPLPSLPRGKEQDNFRLPALRDGKGGKKRRVQEYVALLYMRIIHHKEMQTLVNEILRFAQDDRYLYLNKWNEAARYSGLMLFDKNCKRAASFPLFTPKAPVILNPALGGMKDLIHQAELK